MKIAEAMIPGQPIMAQINAVHITAKTGYSNSESIAGIN